MARGKVIQADFSKRGKDLYYLKKELRREFKSDKINRVITYCDLKARGRLITK